jgi:SNF2 family DNA or RNA helicase
MTGRLEGRYQQEGVEWMLAKEMSPTPFGILADDMGLGKTMQAISLIKNNPLPQGTLIVVMVGTLAQWRDALIDFGGMRPIIVQSSYKGILPPQSDVVLTAYSSFQGRHIPPCLTSNGWSRIVLDEGHVIRNPKTRLFIELSKLSATRRWILTGTPIQNGEKDLKTLASWLAVGNRAAAPPFIMDDFCRQHVLRRTQNQVAVDEPSLQLPPLTTRVVRITFDDPVERALYDSVESSFKETLAQSNSRHATAIEGLMRCRQICTHPSLYYEGLDRKESKRRRVGNQSHVSSSNSAVRTTHSSKLVYLSEQIHAHQHDKTLVFCTWTLEMKLLQHELKRRGIAALIFDGNLSRDAKEMVLYNYKQTSIPVLILQINCGSTGLNLQCAKRIYITSPHWNPCVELQAIGRAYRKGQKEPVTCTRLVMAGTVEERCIDIQQRKATMISDAMDDNEIYQRLGKLEDNETEDTLDHMLDELFGE